MEDNKIQYQGVTSWRIFARVQFIHLKSHWLRLMLFPAIVAPIIWLQQVSTLNTILGTLIAVSFVPVFIALQMMLAYWLYKRSPYLQKPIKGFISDRLLRTENGLGVSEVEWKMFIKHVEKNDFILLYLSPQTLNILPKEFFANEKDWNKARKIIGAKMQNAATE
ncbi:MAG: YcxB family protein [Pyrinomonadaceae bacterium]|nr:YcxB family protein [Pyrinomonadaceae bacterium]